MARRSLGQPRIGHAGTLDPMATGVLVLLLGRATRLAQFLGQDEKRYEAVVAFGQATSTCDAEGTPIGPRSDTRVERGALDAAITRYRGPQMQTPPAVSAKKVGGHRAYDLVRAEKPVALAAVPVELHEAEIVGFDGHRATLHVTCSAGYYVRALARDLGEALGVGAHLHALRRTRSGCSASSGPSPWMRSPGGRPTPSAGGPVSRRPAGAPAGSRGHGRRLRETGTWALPRTRALDRAAFRGGARPGWWTSPGGSWHSESRTRSFASRRGVDVNCGVSDCAETAYGGR